VTAVMASEVPVVVGPLCPLRSAGASPVARRC